MAETLTEGLESGVQSGMATQESPFPPSEITVRELPPEEFSLLKTISPFKEIGLPDIGRARAIIAQKPTGEIVGFWFAFQALHVEPFWLAEEYRRKPGILRRMWRGIHQIMESAGFNVAWAVIPDVDIPAGTPGQAVRLGFKPVAGKLYFVQVGESPVLSAVDNMVKGNGNAHSV